MRPPRRTLAGGGLKRVMWLADTAALTPKEPAMPASATKALYVRLKAKPGKEAEVESFLKGGLSVVQGEPATATWYAIRMDQTTFGIFDSFPDDAGRDAHLNGPLAAALMGKADELFSEPPSIEKLDVLAAKLPMN